MVKEDMSEVKKKKRREPKERERRIQAGLAEEKE